MSAAEQGDPAVERLPCGCIIATIGDAFVMKPCSLLCEFYLYAVDQAKKLGKPLQHRVDPS